MKALCESCKGLGCVDCGCSGFKEKSDKEKSDKEVFIEELMKCVKEDIKKMREREESEEGCR